ncbi:MULTISPECIES: hypothetical protein [unclassified Sphingomonas]|uniref:hypothetical protein n=1 Tax=unclassified Sphingomonas TaxID=196159 RepID=UPI000E733167|nr:MULTISPECIES: hypothetical protein [unclassified Sphingomonas]RKE45884.1 hypothetical protein C8J39_3023 [Sphingomonas sp. PP-CC-1A-547]TCM06832.1 hypothetical protein C8J41_104256 [Sphingomonas sp. PP-CC-3G-468]
MTTDTVALFTAWIHQRAHGKAPARTLLVGAATLTARYSFGTLAFDLAAHSTTVTDNPAETIRWLAERLHVPPTRLLLWRAEDIVIPSLISACETARDTVTAASLLRELDLTLGGEMIDVADSYGGGQATSFDSVSHAVGLPLRPMMEDQLHEAHRTGCHGAIRTHLASRAINTWRLWIKSRADAAALIAATDAWIATPDAEVRL